MNECKSLSAGNFKVTMGDVSTEIPTLSGSGKSFTTSTRAAASIDIIVRTPDLYNDASSLSVHYHLLDANGNPQVTTVAPVMVFTNPSTVGTDG